MAQEVKMLLYKGYAFTKYTHPGPTTTAVAADTSPTHAAGNTGFIQLLDANRIPDRGMVLEIDLPGAFTPSGASGTATLTFTVTFSDDGSATVAGLSHVSQGVVFTAATGPVATITTPTPSTAIPGATYVLLFRLPEIRHSYIKVAWATVLVTITTMAYGPMTISLQQYPDSSEASNTIDIG